MGLHSMAMVLLSEFEVHTTLFCFNSWAVVLTESGASKAVCASKSNQVNI